MKFRHLAQIGHRQPPFIQESKDLPNFFCDIIQIDSSRIIRLPSLRFLKNNNNECYSHGLGSACLTKVVEGAVNEGQFTSEVGLCHNGQDSS